MQKRKSSEPTKHHEEIRIDHFLTRIKDADMNELFIMGSIALVLFLGVYALYKHVPEQVDLAACGKIVVAAEGQMMGAEVSPTLAGAPFFLVINPLNKTIVEALKNPFYGQLTDGQDVAYFIAGKGEEAVIVGQINPLSQKVFTSLDIRVFAGYVGRVDRAVSLYRQARINQNRTNSAASAVPMRNGAVQPVAFNRPMGAPLCICPNCQLAINPMPQTENRAANWPVLCPRCQAPLPAINNGAPAPAWPELEMGAQGTAQNQQVAPVAWQTQGLWNTQKAWTPEVAPVAWNNGCVLPQNQATPVAWNNGCMIPQNQATPVAWNNGCMTLQNQATPVAWNNGCVLPQNQQATPVAWNNGCMIPQNQATPVAWNNGCMIPQNQQATPVAWNNGCVLPQNQATPVAWNNGCMTLQNQATPVAWNNGCVLPQNQATPVALPNSVNGTCVIPNK